MALLKDRNRFAEMQTMSRWMWARAKMKAKDMLNEIRDDEYLIANLEQKQKEFEEANENLIKENKDLSGFTEDGKIIRKNMEKLVEETTRIKNQISETDEDFEELLRNNERLKQELAEMEGKVAEAKN